jgi:hypothetical protein
MINNLSATKKARRGRPPNPDTKPPMPKIAVHFEESCMNRITNVADERNITKAQRIRDLVSIGETAEQQRMKKGK